MQILCAEDDPVSRRLIQYMITKSSHQAIGVPDGLAAWDILKKPDGPRFAILDWMMPGMTDVEVCQAVRNLERGKSIYIMILTSRGSKEDIAAGFNAGADDYLVKPVSQIELSSRINIGLRILDLQSELLRLKPKSGTDQVSTGESIIAI